MSTIRLSPAIPQPSQASDSTSSSDTSTRPPSTAATGTTSTAAVSVCAAADTVAPHHLSELARLEGPQGPAQLPLYAARTISVAVESAGDGDPAEQDPESLATAYLLGDSHWSR